MEPVVGAAVIVFDAEDPCLVALGRRIKRNGWHNWTLCGGRKEANELPLDAATRELGEEFGVIRSPEELTFISELVVRSAREDPARFTMHYYYTRARQDEVSICAPLEFDDIVWYNVHQVLRTNFLQMWDRDRTMIRNAYNAILAGATV